VQESGRGRLGRKWESDEGNLFLSIVARLEPSASWSWVPMATAVAIAECLAEFNPRLDLRIKWPNDLWLGGAKLGGILCEASGGASNSFIVIGVGLNCAQSPQGLDQKTTFLSEFVTVSADEIRMPLVTSILGVLSDLKTQGSQALIARYERRAVLRVG